MNANEALFDVGLEGDVIGSILINPACLTDLVQFLKTEDFHDHRSRLIYQAAFQLHEEKNSIDITTISSELNSAGHLKEVGGPAFLAGLINQVPTSMHAETYARQIHELAKRRKAMARAEDLAKVIISGNGDFSQKGLDILDSLRDILKPDARSPDSFQSWADLEAIVGPITWQWERWLANGLLALLVAASGMGKTALALRLGGCYLAGLPWPDGTPFTGETGCIVWCESESFQAANLERAKAWGLPVEKIFTPLENPLDDFKLDNPTHKGSLVEMAFKPEVRLIVVDSLSGANSRSEKDTEMLPLVLWLAALARDTEKPVLLTHHLRKKGFQDTDVVDLDRVRGSSSIVQPARLVWALDTPDPNAKNWKRLSVIKSNLARFPEPVGMTIDESGVKFGLAPTLPKVESASDRAADLVLALLSDEPMRATVIEEEFRQAGISWKTANNAKKRLGVNAVRKADGWWWSLLPKRESYEIA
jgi:hypothetical protein